MGNFCTNPILAYKSKDKAYNPITGKYSDVLFGFTNFLKLVSDNNDDYVLNLIKNGCMTTHFLVNIPYIKKDYDVVLLPCRKCNNCCLKHSREWAIRNSLESLEYNEFSKLFITLTYDNNVFELDKSRVFTFKNKYKEDVSLYNLNYRDVQLFLKRLRKKFYNQKIRFYLCGEYGSKTLRPHYHILLYGLDLRTIPDLDLLYKKDNYNFYKSELIEKIWSLGFVNITTFSNYTSMYVARYCMKKANSSNFLNYCFANSKLVAPFNKMSTKPGIAYNYIITHNDDIYKYDELLFHIDNKTFRLKPFGYFDKLYDIENPYHFNFIKDNRKKFAQEHNYLTSLESNYGLIDYLNNVDSVSSKCLSVRKEV